MQSLKHIHIRDPVLRPMSTSSTHEMQSLKIFTALKYIYMHPTRCSLSKHIYIGNQEMCICIRINVYYLYDTVLKTCLKSLKKVYSPENIPTRILQDAVLKSLHPQ